MTWISLTPTNTQATYGWFNALQTGQLGDSDIVGFDYFNHIWDWNKARSKKDLEDEVFKYRFFQLFVQCALGMGSDDPRILKYEEWRVDPEIPHVVEQKEGGDGC
jgi:hypothetical protein